LFFNRLFGLITNVGSSDKAPSLILPIVHFFVCKPSHIFLEDAKDNNYIFTNHYFFCNYQLFYVGRSAWLQAAGFLLQMLSVQRINKKLKR